MQKVCSNCCSLGRPDQFIGFHLLIALSAGNNGQRRLHANGGGGLMPQCDFHAVNTVYGGVACRCAPECRYQCVRNKTHVHQVVLYAFRQVKGNQDPAFTHVQFT